MIEEGNPDTCSLGCPEVVVVSAAGTITSGRVCALTLEGPSMKLLLDSAENILGKSCQYKTLWVSYHRYSILIVNNIIVSTFAILLLDVYNFEY